MRPFPAEYFRCKECRVDIAKRNHSMNCVDCNEILLVGRDLVDTVQFCLDVAGDGNAARTEVLEGQPSTSSPREPLVVLLTHRVCGWVLTGQLKRARLVKEYLERLTGHVVRGKWQDRFRGETLASMPFTECYLLHDYWAKFKAVKGKGGQCEDNYSMSVEGFVLIGIVPPWGAAGVDWALMPEGADVRAKQLAEDLAILRPLFDALSMLA